MLSPSDQAQFERDGYFHLRGALQGKLLEDVRREANALADTAPADAPSRIWHERALFRRAAFREVLRNTRLTHAARDLIGSDVQLLAMDLLFTPPGKGAVAWHRDVEFTCNKTLSMNTGIYLDDMNDDNGPLRVVPGSHRTGQPPAKSGAAEPREVIVPVNAGDAVFFDAGLLHSGSPNRSPRRRIALFPYFGRYFVKRMDGYFTQPLPDDLLNERDPLVRQLLGLSLTPGALNYHGDSEGYNRSRGEAGIDFPAT